MSEWPSIACTARRSAPCSSRWVAKLWRRTCVDTGADAPGLEDLPEALPGHRRTAQVDEHRVVPPLGELRPQLGEVPAERALGLLPYRYHPLLRAFAEGEEVAPLEVDLRQPEPDELRNPKAGGIEQLEHRPVAQPGVRRQVGR